MSPYLEIAAELEQELADSRDEIMELKAGIADDQKQWIELKRESRRRDHQLEELRHKLMISHSTERDLIREVRLLRGDVERSEE